MDKPYDYTMFKNFIDKFPPFGFLNISRHDPLIIEMEKHFDNSHHFLRG